MAEAGPARRPASRLSQGPTGADSGTTHAPGTASKVARFRGARTNRTGHAVSLRIAGWTALDTFGR